MAQRLADLAIGMAVDAAGVRTGLNDIERMLGSGTARMNRHLSKAERGFSKFNRSIRRTVKEMTSLRGIMANIGAVSGLGAGLGFGALIESSNQAIDRLAKTADRLGSTTEELAALQHAGEQTGVAVNTMNMALQRMTRRVAEAAAGTGEAKGALAELGLSAQRLNQLSPAGALAEIAEAMNMVENQSDRVRLAFKLFDSEGVALLNTLKVGREGLIAYAEDAERLGITISRTDAAMIEAANDARDRLGKAFKGLGMTLARDLAPDIIKVSDAITDMVVQMREFTESGIIPFLNKLSGAWAVLWRTVDEAAAGFNLVLSGLPGAIGEYGERNVAALEKSIKEWNEVIDAISGRKPLRSDAITNYGLDRDMPEGAGLDPYATMQNKTWANYWGQLKRTMSTDEFKRFEALMAGAMPATGETRQREPGLNETFEELEKTSERVSDKIEEDLNGLTVAAEDFGQAISDSTASWAADFALSTDRAGMSFKGFIDGMIRDLARMAIQKGILNLFSKLPDIGRGIGGLFNRGPNPLDIIAGGRADVEYHGGGVTTEAIKGVGMSSGKRYDINPDELIAPLKSIKGGGRGPITVNTTINAPGATREDSQAISDQVSRTVEAKMREVIYNELMPNGLLN